MNRYLKLLPLFFVYNVLACVVCFAQTKDNICIYDNDGEIEEYDAYKHNVFQDSNKLIIFDNSTGTKVKQMSIDQVKQVLFKSKELAKKSVLLEEYVGQRDVNSPAAYNVVDNMDNVIAVAIHGGPLGFSGNSKYVGLKTDIGDEYYEYWNIEAIPSAIINRQGCANPDYTKWGKDVEEVMSQLEYCSIDIKCDVDDDTRLLTVYTEVQNTEGTLDGNLQLWLVEDNVEAMQMMPDGTANGKYIHNNVFRTAVNGTWGKEISVSEKDYVKTKEEIFIPTEWNIANLSVVAFVYNENGAFGCIRKHI